MHIRANLLQTMIAHLRGKLLKAGPSWLIIDTGGVGYRVLAPVTTLSSLPPEGQEVALHIHTSVREDAIELFGFAEEVEKEVFETLTSVSGVGPKMALAVISAVPVRDLASAVRADGARLQSVPGIGKKTAGRIALEVGEKLQNLALLASADQPAAAHDVLGDVVEGLVALGYSRADAHRSAQSAMKAVGASAEASEVIREALAQLTR